MVKTRDQCIKRTGAKTWNVVDAIDIRSRVSFKSTRNLKTSSKYIAKLQLEESRKNPSFIVCPTMRTAAMKLYTMGAGSFNLSRLNSIDPSMRSHEEPMHMISSCNGLICCVNQICKEDVESKFHDLQIWICNPCTGETLLLPQGRPSFKCEPSVGVAYGSDISDYRVFRIFCAGKKIPEEWLYVETCYPREGGSFRKHHYALAYECEVYSSSTGSWQNIGPVPCVPMLSSFVPHRSVHVFVGGKIYWMVSLDDPDEILSVDMEGRFEVMKLPYYYENQKEEDKINEATHLFILQGSLALLVIHPKCMDIWIWKEVGEKYTWEFERVVKTRFTEEGIVLAITSSKNQIIFLTDTHWRRYDVVTGIWKRRRAPRTGFDRPALFPFTESVLPCNGGVRL